ncbi:hypothetical protein FGRMN_3575 [Fusarium graminum]|nr:hypothetical protein FGRMN_3575 [Fusarium graminum]
MTSPANQQNPIPANNTPATTASSYASAASAPKKSAQAPIVATGSHPPAVVEASSSSQNAKDASSSPVNGKTAVTPAVPAVSRSSANINGSDHSRKSSVTMAANGPNSFVANGGPVSGPKSNIQFGFDSPAMGNSTPQSTNAAPIPIPGGNPRVSSPAHSPSPIPQPSASGGRPPSGLQQAGGNMTFGSLGSDGEVGLLSTLIIPHFSSEGTADTGDLQRHMRQGSVPTNLNAQPGAHFRRESGHSAQGEGAGRGNFQPQGGRGRGYNPHGNNFNQQMGYPPNNQFRNGPGQGRGMPPPFQPQGRGAPYTHSPQPARSPALVPSMPNTPNMQTASMQPNMSMQTPPQYHYPPPMAQQHQQVQYPLSQVDTHPSKNSVNYKPKRGDREQLVQVTRRQSSSWDLHDELNQRQRFSKRSDRPWQERDVVNTRVLSSSGCPSKPPQIIPFHDAPISLDISPETGCFEHLLTLKNQNYGYPPAPQVDAYGRPMSMPYNYNNMTYMAPPQANSPGYNQNFVAPYHQQSHSMSRTPSQPERPPSANQQSTPLIVSSTPQPHSSSLKPTANSFVKVPKKSAAIQIKNAAGEIIDTSAFKAPSSPAPSIQQSKTPPVVASSATPPPKPTTPSHGRTDSHAAPKTAKQIQDELKEKIKQATQAPKEDKPKDEDKPKPVEQSQSQTEDKPVEQPEAKSTEFKDEPAPVTKVESENKPQPEPEVKPSEPSPKIEETKKEEPNKEEPKEEPEKPAEPAKNDDPDEDEMERMIREMEEEDARREKAEEEHRKKREAEKAAAKAQAEKDAGKNAAEADRKLREQEREMERLEEEREKRRQQAEASGAPALSIAELLSKARSGEEPESAKVESVTDKLAGMNIAGDKPAESSGPKLDKRTTKPAALNLTPLSTKTVEPAQPSAALQSLKSARFLKVIEQDIYPEGIKSPNPALNAAVQKKGKTFKYDANFLLQFQKVFTEQPSLEFHQQVKSLIGDERSRTNTPGGSGRNPSNRGAGGMTGGSPFGQMGSFQPPASRGPVGPNTTSEERFKISNSRGGISMGRPGTGFPTVGGSARGQGSFNSPSRNQSGRGNRNSRRGPNPASDAQAAKTMPLTAGQELKPIAVTSTGWKPRSVGKGASASGDVPTSGLLEPEMVQRKVKAALNKMTPEKFDKIADQILDIASQSKQETDGRTLRQVIQLTFEKATDEAHWASMYAKFCKRMLETMSPEVRDDRIKDRTGQIVSGGNLFRKYLLNRCQEEFERGWAVNLPEKPEEEEEGKKTGEAALLSDEYYAAAAAKRRGLGLVQFIGELYKLGMLTERIMHECVHKLVDYKGVPDEAEIESLSKLLRTIGANLDSTEKGRPMMDAYFQRIQTMMDLPELPSRLKFMLLDVVDLRRANWVSKETNKGPKTLDEVRAEAEAAQAAKAQESARNNQRGGGRPPAGRGDARNFSGGGYVQQNSNQVGMDDLRRLKGSANRTSSGNISLGPASMLSSRSNSGRRGPMPGGFLGPREDSTASSRSGTASTRENTSHSNAFSLLANMDNDHPASPPSTSASPAMSKAVAADSDKKESE